MKPNYNDIAAWYLRKLIISEYYFSSKPVKDVTLLYPPFFVLIQQLIKQCADQDINIVTAETYRSNTLQGIYFQQGASKIKSNGMHHYGIAVDLMFNSNDIPTYKGPYTQVQQLYKQISGVDLSGLWEWDLGHMQMIEIADQQDLRDTVAQTIIDFQRTTGLVADGIVGPVTQAKAIELYGTETT